MVTARDSNSPENSRIYCRVNSVYIRNVYTQQRGDLSGIFTFILDSFREWRIVDFFHFRVHT